MINFIGFLLPPFIDLINRKIADDDARFWTSVLVCTAIGFLISYVNHDYHFLLNESFEAALIVVGQAQIAFHGAWKKMVEARSNITPHA